MDPRWSSLLIDEFPTWVPSCEGEERGGPDWSGLRERYAAAKARSPSAIRSHLLTAACVCRGAPQPSLTHLCSHREKLFERLSVGSTASRSSLT